MAEGGGLLNRYRVKSSIGGSNPPLSAISRLESEIFKTYGVTSTVGVIKLPHKQACMGHPATTWFCVPRYNAREEIGWGTRQFVYDEEYGVWTALGLKRNESKY